MPETREGQGPLEEGSQFGSDVDFVQLQTFIAESGHGFVLGTLSEFSLRARLRWS
jgi:hypothetical protein